MWIESVLSRKLDRVTAPEQLWERIQNPALARLPIRKLSSRDRRPQASSLGGLGTGLHHASACPLTSTGLDNDRRRRGQAEALPVPVAKGAVLAWTSIAATLIIVLVWGLRPRHDLVFRSGNATQIREWVKANAGVDIPLLGHSRQISLIGARLMRGDVEIACRVGNREATLKVSKDKSILQHGVQPAKERSTVAWGMSGRLYTLASTTPEDLRIACLLCHS